MGRYGQRKGPARFFEKQQSLGKRALKPGGIKNTERRKARKMRSLKHPASRARAFQRSCGGERRLQAAREASTDAEPWATPRSRALHGGEQRSAAGAGGDTRSRQTVSVPSFPGSLLREETHTARLCAEGPDPAG